MNEVYISDVWKIKTQEYIAYPSKYFIGRASKLLMCVVFPNYFAFTIIWFSFVFYLAERNFDFFEHLPVWGDGCFDDHGIQSTLATENPYLTKYTGTINFLEKYAMT